MQNPQVDRSRPEANERLAGPAPRAGVAPAKLELARDWPPAAKVRGEFARAVGFNRRQFEGRSGPAGSVALALLMAPDRASSTAARRVARSTPANRASSSGLGGTGVRGPLASAQVSSAVAPLESGAVEDVLVDGAIHERQTVARADGQFADEPLSERRTPRADSTAELAHAHEAAVTPRWARPLVDRALSATNWGDRNNLSWELAEDTQRGRDVDHSAGSHGQSGPLTNTNNTLWSTLRDEVVNHLRHTPRIALSGAQRAVVGSGARRGVIGSGARRAWATCAEALGSLGFGGDHGTTVRAQSDRAEFLATANSSAPTRAAAPSQHSCVAVNATSNEFASSELASAAVFTSLLALLFML